MDRLAPKTPFADAYLAGHRFVSVISDRPERQPGLIVVMPCCNEPDLLRSLQSLYDCTPPVCFTEVIVVINHPEDAGADARRQNEQSLHTARLWAEGHPAAHLRFHVAHIPDVPVKQAGVGFARKAGMDEAVYRFNLFDAKDGVIAGFDADAVCDPNYLTEIERCFSNTAVNGASVYFEHPLAGTAFPPSIYDGIVCYELHLRYLNQAMRYAGFPYAFHTVGSSFAVRASAYVKQGGMNQRKAGEDFHFLHKIIPLGNYREINTTRVVPSPRISDRVPFGTGASMRRWMTEGAPALYTYPTTAFDGLKAFFALVPAFYASDSEKIGKLCASLPKPILTYLVHNDYLSRIAEINRNSASDEHFRKRFWAWFNGLQIVKYLNYACRDYFAKQPADKAASDLLRRLDCTSIPPSSVELLLHYRAMERRGVINKL